MSHLGKAVVNGSTLSWDKAWISPYVNPAQCKLPGLECYFQPLNSCDDKKGPLMGCDSQALLRGLRSVRCPVAQSGYRTTFVGSQLKDFRAENALHRKPLKDLIEERQLHKELAEAVVMVAS